MRSTKLVNLLTLVALTFTCKTPQSSDVANSSGSSSSSSAPQTGDIQALSRELAGLKEVGFDPGAYSAKGKKGLENIRTGKAIPFPLPKVIWDKALAGIISSQSEAGQWLAEGTVPISWNRQNSGQAVIGLGDAVYQGDADVTVVTKTCFQCHAGTVAGMTVAGLPHSNFDAHGVITTLKSVLPKVGVLNTARAIADPFGILRSTSNWAVPKKAAYDAYVQDFKSYAENFFMPPFDYAFARGDNHGAYSVWLMAARMNNPEKTGILMGPDADKAKIALFEQTVLPNIDTLPWWTIKFKKRAYWFWDATYHSPAAFNLNFYTPRAADDTLATLERHTRKLKQKVEVIDEVLQFARETEPPSMPEAEQVKLASEWAQVEKGRELFHNKKSYIDGKTCASCHGSYKFIPVNGNDEMDIEVDFTDGSLTDVGTDPHYNATLQKFKPLAENINATAKFYHNFKGADGRKVIADPKYAPFSYVVTKPGYHSPVLVGIWATAPYLHNGSVPTLAALFEKPETRPKIWGRSVWSPRAYNFNQVGIAYDEITLQSWLEKRDAAKTFLLGRDRDITHPSQVEFRRFYNTLARDSNGGELKEGFGRGNGGHEYGVEWANDEKQATIAFMKALAPIQATAAVKKVRKIYPKTKIPLWADGNYLDPAYGPNSGPPGR